MLRIIDGEVFEGKSSLDRWYLTTVDLGHGHREACVQRAVDWEHIGPLDPESIAAQVLRGERDDPNAAEKREANRMRSARRAKTNIRRRCKAQGLDTLLTLTYRANQTDEALADLHLKLFLESMRRLVHGFSYVAVREPQKRGAWHWHLAVRRLPRLLAARNGVTVKSFNVVRAVWRRVVGDLGGNIDQGRWKGQARKSAARCASYLSKYILKAADAGRDHAKAYRASRCEVPRPTRVEFQAASLLELLDVAYGAWGLEASRTVATAWLAPWKDTFFLATEWPDGVRGE